MNDKELASIFKKLSLKNQARLLAKARKASIAIKKTRATRTDPLARPDHDAPAARIGV